ncbi:MAG: UDP-2,4-diacetamido-2,4,6-trideoxy-beta-L-altropyranose hydrolase [Candidatus Brocadia sp.]|jgi:UDP-2,4-diacetamido-2,4,6-trideoxy-beta-L-altropyranose hydrolase
MNIVFRADASVDIGTGHIYRCLTLAEAVKNRGADILFICREEKGSLIDFVKKKGYYVYPLPAGIDFNKDLRLSIEILKGQKKMPDWLVVDHYGIDIKWESLMRPLVKKIMVIDDLADRKHDCDILLDQNYNKNSSRYNGLIPENCIQILGPEYALVRPQFREARENLKKESGEVKRILVFMGGADPTNETGKALKAAKLLNSDNIAVDVVIGVLNPFKNKIINMAKQMPNTTCYFNVNNMAELMSSADISIGASGSSTWERCCVGLPSIVMVLADNQKEIAQELERQDVAVNLGWHENVTEMDIRDAVQNLLADSDKRRSMGLKGKMMVDGNGALRVVEKIIFSLEAISK